MLDRDNIRSLLGKFDDEAIEAPEKHERVKSTEVLTKADRKRFMRLSRYKPDMLPQAQNAAAIEIQRVWRGYYLRFCQASDRLAAYSVLSCYSGGTRYADSEFGLRDVASVSPLFEASPLFKKYELLVPEMVVHITFHSYCALLIQAAWRRYLRHRIIQHNQGVLALKRALGDKRTRDLTAQEAARTIQRAWIRHSDRNVYRHFRDLIYFQHRGDPATMLRSINPREASLFDAAMGVFVRFRLGGNSFPPKIYYRIFTHRPIADMCAIAPRDYTRDVNKQPLPCELHLKNPAFDTNFLTSPSQPPPDTSGWYHRIENNGWRLVSSSILNNLTEMTDPISVETNKRQQKFHFSKLQRRKDVEARRKAKQIEWKKKMFMKGMADERKNTADTSIDVDIESLSVPSLTKTPMSPASRRFAYQVQKNPGGAPSPILYDCKSDIWEKESAAALQPDLVEWSKALDYDSYCATWSSLATTGHSDDRDRFFFVDKYELTDSEWELHMTYDRRLRSRGKSASSRSTLTRERSAGFSRPTTGKSQDIDDLYLTGGYTPSKDRISSGTRSQVRLPPI